MQNTCAMYLLVLYQYLLELISFMIKRNHYNIIFLCKDNPSILLRSLLGDIAIQKSHALFKDSHEQNN